MFFISQNLLQIIGGLLITTTEVRRWKYNESEEYNILCHNKTNSTNSSDMCGPTSPIAPATVVHHGSPNSTLFTDQLTDSMKTNVSVNITGSVIIIVLMLISFLISYFLYRLSKLHYKVHSARFENLARHTRYPTAGAVGLDIPVPGHSNLMSMIGLPRRQSSRVSGNTTNESAANLSDVAFT